MDRQRFNDAIADAFNEDDPELRNWLSTQKGRALAGIHTEKPVKGICPLCGQEGQIATRRRNSAYADDENNWMTSCGDCFQEDHDRLQDQWDEYYSMVR